jgi:hypothetical protein
MKGDFSRATFDRRAHFARVLMQQGRVLLDADWNEQTSILLHYLRTLAADLIGPHGGPAADLAFEIVPERSSSVPPRLSDLRIGRGRYYVDGFLCEIDDETLYTKQPYWRGNEFNDKNEIGLPLLVYLDVWERDVNALEEPRIREVALGGADTAARSRVVWQVRLAQQFAAGNPAQIECRTFANQQPWKNLVAQLQPENRGRLAAQASIDGIDTSNPCIQSPDARYRGAENHLYRVEIHRGGPAGQATFKWSRDNGSVVFPVESFEGTLVTVESLGRDATLGLETGDWIEVVDAEADSGSDRAPLPLRQVREIDPITLSVTLDAAPAIDTQKILYLRRWDHQAGDAARGGLTIRDGAALVEATAAGKWLQLEDGIRIRFDTAGQYRAGDYWLIPARTETGDVEWPAGNNGPALLPPHGVEHHYAPLALLWAGAGAAAQLTDLRHIINETGSCCPRLTIENPPVASPSAPVTFTAVLNHSAKDAVFRWRIDAGSFASNGPDQSSIIVTPEKGRPSVTATAIVETPGRCVLSASGTCLITGP